MSQSVKVETKKELTLLRKYAADLRHQMAGCPYLMGLRAESEGSDCFEKEMPLWEECFRVLGHDLLGRIDKVEECEAACLKLGAKIPVWIEGEDYRDWLAQFDITAKSKAIQAAKKSELPLSFGREPNADDAFRMSGMGIRWD
jgi:hypothetical protein